MTIALTPALVLGLGWLALVSGWLLDQLRLVGPSPSTAQVTMLWRSLIVWEVSLLVACALAWAPGLGRS